MILKWMSDNVEDRGIEGMMRMMKMERIYLMMSLSSTYFYFYTRCMIWSWGSRRWFSDYESNAALDTYSQADIDDRSSNRELSRRERQEAERAMDRRDKGLPGRRAGRRENMPAFLQSDDEEVVDGAGGLLSGVNTRRRRRQYDERMEEDDVEDEDVSRNVILGVCADVVLGDVARASGRC
jgi:hypothetical protein